MKRIFTILIIVFWDINQPILVQAAPRKQNNIKKLVQAATRKQNDIKKLLRDYVDEREKNKGIFTTTSADLYTKKKPDTSLTILDVRPAGQTPISIDGVTIKQKPITELLDSGGKVSLKLNGEIIVVGTDSIEAVEAMVLLRLAGVKAIAATAGAVAVEAELTGKNTPKTDGPLVQVTEPPIHAPKSSVQVPDISIQAKPPVQIQDIPVKAHPLIAYAPVIISILSVMIAGLLLYFKVLLPRTEAKLKRELQKKDEEHRKQKADEAAQRRIPLTDALQIINDNEVERFPEALNLLNKALVSGLEDADLEDGRFALAYVQTRLSHFKEASVTIAELPNELKEVIYLKLWLLVQQKDYEQAERLYEQHSQLIGDYLESRNLAGAIFLARAQQFLTTNVDRALQYFERLHKLGVFKDKLPADIGDHEIVFGIEALFDKDFHKAQERFTRAKASAKRESKSTLYADIGLLLCEWGMSTLPEIDERLGNIVTLLTSTNSNESLKIEVQLTQGVFLWHTMSLLFSWLRRPATSGLTATDRQELDTRINRLVEIAPQMADPQLIRGLIRYFFTADAAEKSQAIEELDKISNNQVNLPEVHLLVDREKKITEAAHKTLENFLALVKQYLVDVSIPVHLREQLRDRMTRFSRFPPLEYAELPNDVDTAANVSVQDLMSRSAIISSRIHSIVKPCLAKEPPTTYDSITKLLDEYEQSTNNLHNTTQNLEEKEQQVMLVTGEFFLKEEVKKGTTN